MKKPIFSFTSYNFKPKTGLITLNYELNQYNFTEKITIPVKNIDFDKIDKEELNRALFNLHLIGGISYWKTLCPKKIIVKSGTLSKKQAEFWNETYTHGLGEFFYKNQIDFRNLVNFPHSNKAKEKIPTREKINADPLVPIGGGKDSIVTAELLKKQKIPFTMFTAKDATPIKETSKKIGGERIVVKRNISKKLLELNKKPNIYNGHIPITAYLDFLSVVIALINKKTDIIFSLEKSANEGNLEYMGVEINHQYSKSLDFEKKLQNYLKSFVTNQISVFSLIRPLSELHIMKIFSKYPKYFHIFSSCNKNFTFKNTKKKTFWCTKCPKCAFTFAMLSGFLPHKKLISIFGKDLFSKPELADLFRELLGIQGNKPFECVGEAKEVAAALELCYCRGDANHTKIMQLYEKEARKSFKNADSIIKKLLSKSKQHSIPEEYKLILDQL
jgi:hypothetical protein